MPAHLHPGAALRPPQDEQAIVYARASGPSQDLQQQLDEDVAYIRAVGYRFDARRDVYKEVVSGTRTDRAGFWDLLKRIEEGGVDVLVAYDLYRAGSNDLDAALLAMKCKEKRVRIEVASTQGAYILDNPESKLMYRIQAAVADYRRENIIITMNRGKRHLARKGYWTSGSPPFGYSITGPRGKKRLVPNEHASLAREVFERYARGESAQGIARWLRGLNIPNGRGLPMRWCANRVGGFVLDNPTYIGMLHDGETMWPGNHEPIVTRELFEAVAARRAQQRARNPGRPKRPPIDT